MDQQQLQKGILKNFKNFLRKILVTESFFKKTAGLQSAIVRSSHRRCSVKKGVLRNVAKFTGKHLCQRLFSNKFADLRPATLLKKSLWHRCFPVNFAKFLITPFLQNTSGRLLLNCTVLRHGVLKAFSYEFYRMTFYQVT